MTINKATIEFYDNNPQYKLPGSYLSELMSNLSLAENHNILVGLLKALSNEDSLFVTSLEYFASLQNTKLAELIKTMLGTVESFSIEVEDVNKIISTMVITYEELDTIKSLVVAQEENNSDIIPLSGDQTTLSCLILLLDTKILYISSSLICVGINIFVDFVNLEYLLSN